MQKLPATLPPRRGASGRICGVSAVTFPERFARARTPMESASSTGRGAQARTPAASESSAASQRAA